MEDVRKLTVGLVVDIAFQGVVFAGLLFLAQGCLPMYRDNGVPIYAFSSDAQPLGATAADGEWQCPYFENVQIYQGQNLDGTGEFKTCTHNADADRLRIEGSTRGDAIICIIPTTYADGGISMVRDSSGNLAYQCVVASYSDGTSVGTYYDFVDVQVQLPTENFNSVIMVNSGDLSEMDLCIGSGAGTFNPGMCPDFSFGMVR